MAKPKNSRPDIGRRLRGFMKNSNGLRTQAALSVRSGVAQSTISRLLNHGADPGIATLDKLARALGRQVAELTGELTHSPGLLSGDGKIQPGQASQSARIDPDMLIAADEDLELLERTEQAAYDRPTRLRKLSELYNFAVEDGGKLSAARLKSLMNEALERMERGEKHGRGARSAQSSKGGK